MISQVAWRIGRAFAAGHKDAPVEFHEVETEVSGLAKVLKELAEALHNGSSTWQEAGEEVQNGICTIFESCKRTVNDLDSLIDQYQAIKKHRTIGGFAIERSWSDLVLTQYKTMIWTTDGGDLHNLKGMLQMHSIAITPLVQALQRQARRAPELCNN
jgi:hypothetical protein